MTDAQIDRLLAAAAGAPKLTEGRTRYVLVGALVLRLERVGAGERWSWAPGGDTYPAAELPDWWPRSVRRWVEIGRVLDLARHGRAMGARTL